MTAMTCCCDQQNVVQPCGPCRCDDHMDCTARVVSPVSAYRQLDDLQREHQTLLEDFAKVDQENMGLRARIEELESQVSLARDEVSRQQGWASLTSGGFR